MFNVQYSTLKVAEYFESIKNINYLYVILLSKRIEASVQFKTYN
ncbi:hypothetical protein AEQU2_01658 [Aequorivita lipolytica]|nr:hypothetical protein AEQU2_01658 [Aequorivita lipolytica]